MLFYLTLIVLCLFLVHLLMNYNKRARIIKQIPGPKDYFITGNSLRYITSQVEMIRLREDDAKRFNGIYRFWAYPLGVVLIYNPDDMETILSNSKHIEKSIIYNHVRPWLRDGLLLSGGAKWRQRRKMLTNAFHFNILNQFWYTLEENSQKFVKVLEKFEGEKVNIVPILSEYALQSLCETAMGTQLDSKSTDGKIYKHCIYELGKVVIQRMVRLYLYTDFIFNLTHWSALQRKHLQTLHGFTKRIINKRRHIFNQNRGRINKCLVDGNDIYMSNRKNKIAMLDLLLLAEKDGQIDEMGIEEEVDTFMFEGHDTTASALTYCFMSLANDKNIQNKVFEELQGIFGDSERAATTQDLTRMNYLECCIKESLRLYPPVHAISRKLNEDVTLSNYTVPAGALCHVLIYELHRHPDLYKDPLKFDPDRFLPENCIGRHPYAYIPFSAGPRNCIGQRFAMMEMKSAVAAVLRKYELLPVTRHSDLKLALDLVLRNSEPVYVKFVKRK